MKIVFTSSYETFSKENTKNYIPNSYVLVFLISVIFFPYNLGRREYITGVKNTINLCFTNVLRMFISEISTCVRTRVNISKIYIIVLVYF